MFEVQKIAICKVLAVQAWGSHFDIWSLVVCDIIPVLRRQRQIDPWGVLAS